VKFSYIDESGKGNEPVLVLAGIVTDAHRMHVTKSDSLEILKRFPKTFSARSKNSTLVTSTKATGFGAALMASNELLSLIAFCSGWLIEATKSHLQQ
jgi:hypothetical protein